MGQYLGTAGVDSLTGSNSLDYFNGGAGDDAYRGKGGKDNFGNSLGGGVDTVFDFNTTNANHDQVVFDGRGQFELAFTTSNLLLAGRLADGDQFTTTHGDVLTVTDAGDDVSLLWQDGTGVVLLGVDPNDIWGEWIFSLEAY
jgi:hypothetical protein